MHGKIIDCVGYIETSFLRMSSELTLAGQWMHTMEDNCGKVQFVILKPWLEERRDEGWRTLLPGCRHVLAEY